MAQLTPEQIEELREAFQVKPRPRSQGGFPGYRKLELISDQCRKKIMYRRFNDL
jgi:hypothetical protein